MKPHDRVGFLAFIGIVAALGGFLFGYDTVVIAGTIGMVREQFSMSPAMEGWFVSAALQGCFLGVVVAGWLCDRIGRRRLLQLSSLVLLASAVGCGFAPGEASLVIARMVGGIGVGLASIASPLYLSEVSPPDLRGRMVSLFQLTICIGIVVAMLVNAGLAAVAVRTVEAGGEGTAAWLFGSEAWRGMFLSEVVPALAFLALCLVIPPSPRWLLVRGREAEAEAVLTRLRGAADRVGAEMAEIRAALAKESGSLREIFARGWRKALFLGVFLAVFSELSGITIVMYYGPTILEKAGFSMGASLGGHATIGVVLTVFTVIAVVMIDRVGRRPLMLIGNTGAFLSLLAIGLLFQSGRTEGLTLVVLMCLFVASFAFSLGPVKWVVISEIFPTRIRGRAAGLATMALWFTDILLNQFFPSVRDGLGVGATFLLFSAFLVPQFFVVWKVMPETMGRSLEDIEESWRTGDSGA